MKRKLIYSALFLFVLSVSACSNNGNTTSEESSIVDTKGFNELLNKLKNEENEENKYYEKNKYKIILIY